MLTESRAIVLRTIKYNDESFIAETLTEGHGRVSFLVRISRSPRAAVRHTLFQPLALLTICWNHREGNALKRPKSVGVSTPLVSIPYDPRKSAVALFLSEFLQAAIKVEDASGLLFQYIYTSIEWFDTAPKDFANFHLVSCTLLAFSVSPQILRTTAQAMVSTWKRAASRHTRRSTSIFSCQRMPPACHYCGA